MLSGLIFDKKFSVDEARVSKLEFTLNDIIVETLQSEKFPLSRALKTVQKNKMFNIKNYFQAKKFVIASLHHVLQ